MELYFMFYDLFCRLCQEKGVSPTRATIEIGLSRTIGTKWKKTGATPQGDTLQKIADYFGVSVDYLLGNEEKPASQEADELLKDELVAFYGEVKNDLDQDDIDDLKTFMRMKAEIKKNRREKK
jgi:transcriptional regulator with XRE-family HTH domain